MKILKEIGLGSPESWPGTLPIHPPTPWLPQNSDTASSRVKKKYSNLKKLEI